MHGFDDMAKSTIISKSKSKFSSIHLIYIWHHKSKADFTQSR